MSQFFGHPKIDTAKKCFMENVQMPGTPPSPQNAEKYNLYYGLANMAVAIEQMQAEISELRQIVHKLASKR